MASMQTEQKVVTDAMEALQKYIDNDYKGDTPFAQLMICIIKWEQGDDDDPIKIVERAMKDENIVQKAVKLHNEEYPDDQIIEKELSEDKEKKDSPRGVIIVTGESGNA